VLLHSPSCAGTVAERLPAATHCAGSVSTRRRRPGACRGDDRRIRVVVPTVESAFLYWGGIVGRVVLDNTSRAVKDVLAGRDRVQTEAFEGFRGAYPFRAEFCAPASAI